MTEQPGYGPERVVRGLSLPRRVGYLVAGMTGFVGAVLIGSLWATEPAALPIRTQIAFGGMITAGLVWAGFAVWVLVRRPVFAVDRMIAGCLALAFSTLGTVGTTVVALTRGSVAGALISGALGVVMTVLAAVLLIRARAYRRELHARGRDLESRLHQERAH